jgi:HSP20 family molecular chaperone IbpA
MTCRRCGKKVEKGWRFCPNCGSVTERQSRSMFDDIFSRFRREFRDMDKMFNKEFELLDLSPFLRQQGRPRGAGFTIKITRRNNERPDVNVRTFGNIDNNVVRKEVAEGMRPLGVAQPGERPLPEPARKSYAHKTMHKPAKVTEEPKTQVRSLGTRLIVEMELDDVKSESDIDVNELESSVEVRARAGEKAYFKIIKKPEQFSVSSRRFEKGKFYLEFS